jgi:hypothetical protein
MPYLRMFLNEQQIDEVFISEVLLNSVLGASIIEEEKQELFKRHAKLSPISSFVFCIDAMPSAVNHFTPLNQRKEGK